MSYTAGAMLIFYVRYHNYDTAAQAPCSFEKSERQRIQMLTLDHSRKAEKEYMFNVSYSHAVLATL